MKNTCSKLVVVLALFGTVAIAQEPDLDPPESVARLSYLRGDVVLRAGDSDAADPALLNRPVTSGDALSTGHESRAELTTGVAAIRLDEQTEIYVDELDQGFARIEVDHGTISVHLRDLVEGDELSIETPSSTIRLLEPGDYRIDVFDDKAALIGVREGKAEVDSGVARFALSSAEQVQVDGEDRFAQIEPIGRADDFEEWSLERERDLTRSDSARYVSREVVGYEDLDDHGSWYTEPEYGMVWAPRHVSAGWAPYRFGRWSWVSPWGWTWIDDAPWGFAPFHYGRWAHLRNRWCWVPGPRHARPVYAPAVVGWLGGHHSRRSEVRPVGWFPLAPREVYVPAYRASPRHVRNVNFSNTVIVNNTYITNINRGRQRNVHYVNRNKPGGVTSVSHEVFRSEQPVWRHARRLERTEVERSEPSTAAPNIRPARRVVDKRARMGERRQSSAHAESRQK